MSEKNERLYLRLSEDEKDLFEIAAEKAGMKLSEWVRHVLTMASVGEGDV